MSKVKENLKNNTMLFALVLVMAIFQLLITSMGKGSLFAPMNITNLINQNSYVVILACGMLLCILTGGNIDLSVGSIVALVGAVAGTLIVNMGMNVYVSIIISLIVGTLIGAWQAFFIAYVGVPPFICTLAGMLLWRGVALLVLNGLTISPFPNTYQNLFASYLPNTSDSSTIFTVTIIIGIIISILVAASTILSRVSKMKKGYEVGGIAGTYIKLFIICAIILASSFLLGQNKGLPIVLIVMAIIVLAYAYFTSRTTAGRHLYALGGNAKAARLSGINTKRTMFFAYTNMGFLSAVAALVCVARFNSAAPSLGTNYELDSIGACFIGGASAYGGSGTIGGAVIGAIFMGVLNNGMSILGVDANWQKAVKGMVLLAAVIFDVVSKRHSQNMVKA